MTRQFGLMVLAVGMVTALAYGQLSEKKDPFAKNPEKTQPPKTEKPLRLKDDAEVKPGEGMADNSRCHVCHLNYTWETLAVTHARAKIGCEKCHGPSDAHIDDESWTWGGKGTPPDRMYVRDKVNASCTACHEVKKTEPHKVLFSDLFPKKVCTDCHGKHRLATRKCKWK